MNPETVPWQSHSLFITSTFRDMHAERDWLQSRVLPALEERLKGRRRHLQATDLRWGVDTLAVEDESARDAQVLKVCLGDVRRAEFAIALLGDCYGWVPPLERATAAARDAGLGLAVEGKSITQLEIESGFLTDPERRRRCFVYLRDALPYDRMPAKAVARYCDHAGPGPKAAETAGKLTTLKRELERVLPDRVRHYSVEWDPGPARLAGLEAFGEKVTADLWSELDGLTREIGAQAESGPYDTARRELAEFIEFKARGFVGRHALTASVLAFAESNESQNGPWGLCLCGEPGSGKSAFFAHLVRTLADRPCLVLAHGAGMGPASAGVDGMLDRWADELNGLLGPENPADPTGENPTREQRFGERLRRVANQRRVVMLIDGLNEFEPTIRARLLTWLPKPIPKNVRLIVTAQNGPEAEALTEQNGVVATRLPGLDQGEAGQVVEELCARRNRRLGDRPTRVLLAKRRENGTPAWGNPLWLEVALEQLNLLDRDDFARTDREFDGTPAQRLERLIVAVCEEMPPDVRNLYAWTLKRTEETYGRIWVQAVAELLAISRAGWRESDLRALVPEALQEPWNDLTFASVRRGFRGHFIQRGAWEQWNFSHAQMREAVAERGLRTKKKRSKLHRLAANHLETLPVDDPVRESELMFHLLGSGNNSRTARYYGGPLSDGEVKGASRALADLILSYEEMPPNPAVGLVAEFFERIKAQPERHKQMCLRLVMSLDPMLRDARPETRRALLSVARQGLERWTRDEPDHPEGEALLRAVHQGLGDLWQISGDSGEALEAYRHMQHLAEQTLERRRGDSGALQDLATSLQKIGDGLARRGDFGGAFEAYRKTRELAESLASQHPSDFVQRRNLAAAQSKMGDGLWSLRRVPEALEAYQNSCRAFEGLAAAHPNSAALQRDLSIAHEKMGQVLLAQGDLEAALVAYRKMLVIADTLAAKDPLNLEWQFDRVVGHHRVGDACLARGDLAAAGAEFESALELAQRLVQHQPNHTLWIHMLSVACNKLGRVRLKQGSSAEALALFQAALPKAEGLVAQDPSRSEWRTGLVMTYAGLGEAARAGGDEEAARRFAQSFARALRAMRQEHMPLTLGGVQVNPADLLLPADQAEPQDQPDRKTSAGEVGRPESDSDFARALTGAATMAGLPVLHLSGRDKSSGRALARESVQNGDRLLADGNLRGALGLYEMAVRSLDAELKSHPEDPTLASEFSDALLRLGDALLMGARDVNGALQCYHHAKTVCTAFARDAGAGAAQALPAIYDKIGDALLAGNDLEGAMQAYQTSGHHIQQMIDRGADADSWRRNRSVTLNKVGAVCLRKNDPDGACKAYQASSEIAERLVHQNPNDADLMRDLAIVQDGLGDAHLIRGDTARALEAFDKSLAIWRELSEKHPNDLELERDLAIGFERQGNVQLETRQLDAALRSYGESLSIRQRLAAADPSNAEWQQDLAICLYKLALAHDEKREAVPASDYLGRCRRVLKRLQSSGAHLHENLAKLLQNLEQEESR
jgi:tetratricopeptide (TPR) repeat protein